MPEGSAPFTLSREEWIEKRNHLLLAFIAAAAAWGSTEIVPWLSAHANDKLGLAIVALLSAGIPVVAAWLSALLKDTRPKPPPIVLLLLAASLALCSCTHAAPPPPLKGPTQVPTAPTIPTVPKLLRLDNQNPALVIDSDGPTFYWMRKLEDGKIVLIGVSQIVYFAQPGPTPPPPSPVLSDRAKAIKAAADKVSADPNRAVTAKALAQLYRRSAVGARNGSITEPAILQTKTKDATDSLLNGVAAWDGVRSLVSGQWLDVLTDSIARQLDTAATMAGLATMLDEDAAGLDASASSAKPDARIAAAKEAVETAAAEIDLAFARLLERGK